jgi:hypothetical protein
MKHAIRAAISLLAIAFAGCGGSDGQRPASGLKVVPHETLLGFLPVLPDWSQERQPQGDTDTAVGYSRVQVDYTLKGGISGISVEIVDTTMNPDILKPLVDFIKANREERIGDPTAPVFVTPIAVAGFPGRQEWQPHENANNGSLSLLLADRFTVGITGNSLKDADVMKWAAESIDLKKLAALK